MVEDSTAATMAHRKRVTELLVQIEGEIIGRYNHHDLSKLKEPEKSIFDEYTPQLYKTTYGSEEYRQNLKEMQPALVHHRAVNSHHPEHYENGINGMDLIDLIEMIADWKAASERHKDGGDIEKSIKYNSIRFEMSIQLETILKNTVRTLRWVE